MLDYPSIAAVAAVVREGTFERAAVSLGITPSAVSQRVRGLEERLGAILIHRGQPNQPTQLGRELCAHFDRVSLLEHDLDPLLGRADQRAKLIPSLPIAVNADSLATWFHSALADFGGKSTVSLDLKVHDEANTADLLRTGEVLAAVSADPVPVQGCKTVELGMLRYAACASSDYIARHFDAGVNEESLTRAPHLRFDRRDTMQAGWARTAHRVALASPVHWVPSTHAMLELNLAGLGWSLQPEDLVADHLTAGRLVELPPHLRINVKLYWTVSRLHAKPLVQLTRAVRTAAMRELRTA